MLAQQELEHYRPCWGDCANSVVIFSRFLQDKFAINISAQNMCQRLQSLVLQPSTLILTWRANRAHRCCCCHPKCCKQCREKNTNGKLEKPGVFGGKHGHFALACQPTIREVQLNIHPVGINNISTSVLIDYINYSSNRITVRQTTLIWRFFEFFLLHRKKLRLRR